MYFTKRLVQKQNKLTTKKYLNLSWLLVGFSFWTELEKQIQEIQRIGCTLQKSWSKSLLETKQTNNQEISLLVCFYFETKFQEIQRIQCTLQKSWSKSLLETKQVNNEKVFESLLVVSLFWLWNQISRNTTNWLYITKVLFKIPLGNKTN